MTSYGYFAAGKANQEYGYRSGSALRSHMDSAHAGKFDIHCRACLELRIKGFEVSTNEMRGNTTGKPEAPDSGLGKPGPRRFKDGI